MCFSDDYDYDWMASIYETDIGQAETRCRCTECNAVIPVGEWRHHIYMQERECCDICDEMGDYYDEDDPQDPATCQHDFGEMYDYHRCRCCEKILHAIEHLEIVAGCPPHARRPPIATLQENMHEHSDGPKYAAAAVAMFPELEHVEWLTDVLEGAME